MKNQVHSIEYAISLLILTTIRAPNTNDVPIHHFYACVDEVPHESEDVPFHRIACHKLYI